MAQTRVKEVSLTRPIMYGNVTVPLESADRKRDTPPDHTHKWTVFVRDPSGKDDLSYCIKRVIFKLHDTYPQPTRVVEQPPFELTETGWGEFEIQIRILFVPCANEKQIVLHHHLKLHPYGPQFDKLMAEGKVELTSTGVPVAQAVESIVYDELVFNEPTESLLELLTTRPGALLLRQPRPPYYPFSYETEQAEVDNVNNAINTVRDTLNSMKMRIRELEAEKNLLE